MQRLAVVFLALLALAPGPSDLDAFMQRVLARRHLLPKIRRQHRRMTLDRHAAVVVIKLLADLDLDLGRRLTGGLPDLRHDDAIHGERL